MPFFGVNALLISTLFMAFPINYSYTWVIIILCIWVYMMIKSKPFTTLRTPSLNVVLTWKIQFILLFLFITVMGLHRWDTYHMAQWWPTQYFSHFEPFHLWIINAFAYDSYFIYRLIVFGITGLLFCKLARALDDFTNNFCLACTLFLVDSMFSEMRGTIGVMVMLFGIAYLLKQDHILNVKSLLWLLVIGSSFYMHRSMFLTLLLAAVAYFIPLNKKTIKLSWLLFPLFVVATNYIINYFLAGGFDLSFGDEMQLADKAQMYAGDQKMERTLVGQLTNFIAYLPLYLSFFYLAKKVGYGDICLDRVHSYFFRIFYVCVYVASLLNFVETSTWLVVRISVIALYPLPFILSRIWSQEIYASRWTKAIIYSSIIAVIFSMTYRIYIWH